MTSRYEDSMWNRLAAEHADELADLPPHPDDPEPRRGRPWAFAGGTVVIAGTAAATVLVISATSTTTPAYAVNRHADGSVQLTLRRASGVAGLNARLKALGVPAQVVAARSDCRGQISVAPVAPAAARARLTAARAAVAQATLHPRRVKPGWTQLIVASRTRHGGLVLIQSAARRAVPACAAPVQSIAGKVHIMVAPPPAVFNRGKGPVTCMPASRAAQQATATATGSETTGATSTVTGSPTTTSTATTGTATATATQSAGTPTGPNWQSATSPTAATPSGRPRTLQCISRPPGSAASGTGTVTTDSGTATSGSATATTGSH
jgi:hypothetical protein